MVIDKNILCYANNVVSARRAKRYAERNNIRQNRKEVERLTPKDQLNLLEKLAHQLKKTGAAMKKNSTGKGFTVSEKDCGKVRMPRTTSIGCNGNN